MNTREEKLVRWFMFSVLVSLVPLASSYFNLWLDGRAAPLEALVARGELLLICTTLGAAAIGELFPGGRENAAEKLLAGGASFLLIMVSTVFFTAAQSRNSPGPRSILIVSLALFVGMLAAAASCIFYSHREVR
jgi:hypothetical protein